MLVPSIFTVITGATVSNTGSMVFSKDVDVASSQVAGLFAAGEDEGAAQGEISLADGSTVTVTGSDVLDFGTVSSNITANGNNTWVQDNVQLGPIYTGVDDLSLEVKNLTAQEEAHSTISAGDNAFVMTKGVVTVSDSLTLVKTDDALEVGDEAAEAVGPGHVPQDRVYVYGTSGAATLNLSNNGNTQGRLVNVDRVYVGYTSDNSPASESSTLNVSGNWDFGGSRLVAGTEGPANLDGTVSNIESFMMTGSGKLNVLADANVTVQRLLGSESNVNGATITVNGNLTITGDDNDSDVNAEGSAVRDVTLTKAGLTIENGGTFAITDGAVDDVVDIGDPDNDGVTTVTVTEANWVKDKVAVAAGGTLRVDLGEINLGDSGAVTALKNDLIGDDKGILDLGDATYNVEHKDGLVQEDALVTGVTTSNIKDYVLDDEDGAISISTEVSAVQTSQAAGVTVSSASLTLSNASKNEGNVFVLNTDTSEAANVELSDGATITFANSGEGADVTLAEGKSGSATFRVGAGNTQNFNKIAVTNATVTGGTLNAESITATNNLDTTNNVLNVSGDITLGSATAVSTHNVVGSNISAESITLRGNTSNVNNFNVKGGSSVTVETFTGATDAIINIGTDGDEAAA